MAGFVVQHCGPELGVVDLVSWTLFFDGSSCGVGSGIDIVLVYQAEYHALLKGIRLLQEIGADAVEIFGDFMLVVNQLIGIYECKDDILRIYHEECC